MRDILDLRPHFLDIADNDVNGYLITFRFSGLTTWATREEVQKVSLKDLSFDEWVDDEQSDIAVIKPMTYGEWAQYKLEQAIKSTTNLSFSYALNSLRNGMRVARHSWKESCVFVYLVPGGKYKTQTRAAKEFFGDECTYNPYLAIKNIDDTVSPWTPSTAELLANDWCIL